MRPTRLTLLGLLIVLTLSAGAFAQPGAAPKPTPGAERPLLMGGLGGFGGQSYSMPAFNLPGYWSLGLESTQKELEIVPEQKQKLKAIAEKYQADMQGYWSQMRDLKPEEQQKKFAEWRERSAKQQEQIRKQVEEVLLPHQLALLKDLNFRSRAPMYLSNPRTIEQIGLTNEQKDKLRKMREELQEKTQKLQKEMFDKSLELLTPEQKKKLQEQVGNQNW